MATVANVTFDCADPVALATFWSGVLDRGIRVAEPFISILERAEGQPNVLFIKVPEPKSAKNRVHLDLDDPDPWALVERVVADGGSRGDEHDQWGSHWITMADPEGNEFCIHLPKEPDA